MKPSNYNFYFEVDGTTTLGYNSLTTALVKFTPDEFGALQEYSAKPRDGYFAECGLGTFQEDLEKVGLLVPDDREELQQLEFIHKALREQGQRTLGLTIVPTLDCNFRCNYCFSYAQRERMTPSVQEALLRFIEKRLPQGGSVSVAWFGGEPTLCLGLIETLSARIRDICAQRSADYLPGDIITNGFLLTKKAAQRLKDAGVAKGQVTLDGDRATHDGRRPLKNGMGTFARILDNVAEARETLDLQIRINVDRSNAGTAAFALDALLRRGLQGMPVYFGQVKPFTEACAGIASYCLSDREFSKINLSLSRRAIARGFPSLRYPQTELGGVCGAEHANSYLVAPDGLLFKCWAQASLGPEHSIGSVFEDEVTPEQERNLKQFTDWDPLHEDGCRACDVLPLCMGGCRYLRLNGSSGANCSPWRDSLLDTLALRYKTEQLFKYAQQTIPQRAE